MNTMKLDEVARYLNVNRQQLSELTVARIMRHHLGQAQPSTARRPATAPAEAADYTTKSVRDVGYHLQYLAQAVAVADTALFTEYVAWVQTLFEGLGFSPELLVQTLQSMRAVLFDQLPADAAAVAGEYLELGMQRLGASVDRPASQLPPSSSPLSDLARAFQAALLAGQRHRAGELIMTAVDEGVPVKDIYLEVFQRSQHEIGRLWQLNRITVAQEHYVTAATQMIMAQLYPHIFAHERNGRRLVATSVVGELHEMGIRMVVDFFEMDGWDTYYLGANTPTDSIINCLAQQQADILAVSATITHHLDHVADLIRQVRQSDVGPGVRIIVGGYPFNLSPSLWRQVGADGYGSNAAEAVAVANRLAAAGPA